jgi:hypothetical protein
MYLYRPVGLFEYRLIVESGFSRFPPRLYWQPIFYPVLTQQYAEKIAHDWNTKDVGGGYIGYVLRFDMPEDYISKFEVKVVGDSFCQELWVPAAQLDEFNAHIQGKIEVVNVFKGERFIEDAQLPEYMFKNDSGVSEW